MEACKFNTINSAVTEVDHLRKNHLQLISNGKVDEKAEEERRSLIKSMSRRNTPNAVTEKWRPVEEISTETVLKKEAPRSSALKSLELFEQRKSFEKSRREEREKREDLKRKEETERRMARRAEFVKKYSSFDASENHQKPEPFPLPSNRRRLSERVEDDMAKSRGLDQNNPFVSQKPTAQNKVLAQNPSQASLPNNTCSSIASTVSSEPSTPEPSIPGPPTPGPPTAEPSTPLKSTATPLIDEHNEIDDFSEKIAEDIDAFKRISRENSSPREFQVEAANLKHDDLDSKKENLVSKKENTSKHIEAEVSSDSHDKSEDSKEKEAHDELNDSVTIFDEPLEFDISSLSKSGQSILRTGSVSDKNPGEKISRSSSSRSSVSDRLKKFEVIDATAINEKRVLNNPRRSLRTSQSKN